MKVLTRTTLALLILAIISLLATILIYSALPSQVPIHFGLDGQVDSYGEKQTLLYLGAMPVGVLLLMQFLPKVDPHRNNYQYFVKTYEVIKVIIVFMIMALHWLLMAVVLGWIHSPQRYIAIIMALVFIVMGNYLPKVKHNYFVGVKTPWTIASKKSWQKTHRLSGYLFTGLGIAVMAVSLINIAGAYYALVAGVIFIVSIVTVYSYVVFKQSQVGGSQDEIE